MKKLLILTTITLLSVASALAQACDGVGGNISGTLLTWNLIGGTLTIGGIGVIPPYYPNGSGQPWEDCRTSIKTVSIENGVTEIGMFAFYECGNLDSVTIQGTVTLIQNFAFANCGVVEKFTLINGASDLNFNIGGFGYYATFSNTYIKTLYLDRNIVCYAPDNSTPFRGQTELTSLTIGSYVLRIPEYCFYGCSALQKLDIPDNVHEIGRYAFYGCSGIESIDIGNGITKIKDFTFYGCSGLSNITIPKKVNLIENFVFANCGELENFKIVNDAEALKFDITGYGYFSTFSNTYIKTLDLGRNLDYYGPNYSAPFRDQETLSTLTIGTQVLNIPNYCFAGCSGLSCIVNLRTTPQSFGYACFDGVNKATCCVYVPEGSIELYKEKEGWKEFVNIIEGTSCDEVPFIELSSGTVVNFGVDGGEKEIIVKSNITWNVSISSKSTEWVTVSPDSGSGDGSFTLKAEKNDCNPVRNAIVTVSGGGITKTINVSQDACVSIENFLVGKLQIYPNPTTGELRIESDELKIENVEIFDVYGRNVGANIQVCSENPENEILLNISHLTAGVYFVKIFTETGEVIKKVLKE